MAMLQISNRLQTRLFGLVGVLDEVIHQERAIPGVHCAVAAEFEELVRELVRCAVLADREAGATWATIGEPLGISAEAARHRYGHVRLIWPPPRNPDEEPESESS
ncbi:hypothetical protein CK936_30240 [Streptomyces albireticuli]|uniref:Uncharacterized protein n=1 Tax=Streptomyces albireticuli TaxID=1940 RepID=A0A2A2D1A6_9ACTN|nr:hypothetical protein CK936_30240 [Streptomyces albireticuli]